MLSGYFSSISGILYNEQRLGVISNNTANVETPGFHRSVLMLRTREMPQERRGVHSAVAQRTPTTHGIERTGVFQDFEKKGKLHHTDSPNDLAIPSELSNAFFAVRKVGANQSERLFSRNGTLSIGKTDPHDPGAPTVLLIGSHVALDESEQPISVDPTEGPVTVNNDGAVFQGGLSIGQIPVYRLNKSPDPNSRVPANLQTMEQLGDSLLRIPAQYASEFHPHRIQVGQNGVSRVAVQGMREGSNVNMFQELVDMMATTKAATANTTALKHQIDSLTKLFEMVRT